MKTHGLAVLVLSIAGAAVSAEAAFTFRIPQGFTDLSPGVPEANFNGLPEGLVAEAKSGKYAAFAMEFGEQDGFFENFNATVSQGALVVNESAVNEWRQKLGAEFSKAMGGQVTVVEVRQTDIGGVPVIRAVFDSALPQVKMRQMQYVVPGGNEYAVLTYSSTPEKFDSYVQLFDAAAMGTGGAAKANVIDWSRSLRMGAYGAGLGLLVALITMLSKKRSTPRGGGGGRRMPPSGPPRRMPPRPASRR